MDEYKLFRYIPKYKLGIQKYIIGNSIAIIAL